MLDLPSFFGNNTKTKKYSLSVHKGNGLLSIFFTLFDKPGESRLPSPGNMSKILTTQQAKAANCP